MINLCYNQYQSGHFWLETDSSVKIQKGVRMIKNLRTITVVAVSLAILFIVWGTKEHTAITAEIREFLRKPAQHERTYEERKADAVLKLVEQKETAKANLVHVDLSSLAGRNLADLYTKYLGLSAGRVPTSVDVSFDERMASMYHQKVMFKKCKKKDSENCVVASDTVLSQSPELLNNYLKSDKMKMGLKAFISVADEKVAKGKKYLDWPMLCKSSAYRLNQERCKLLQSIVGDLQGKDLIAYGMTELLPSADGDLNVKYMDVILRNAGAQFLYYVPALGDRYASIALYQFTFFALREDDEKVEGVSVVNSFVKEGGEKLPGSVVSLSGNQHHTAAFYFAVHNLASFLSRLGQQEVKTLLAIHHKVQTEMVVLIACAHHAPGHTFPTVTRWLRAVEKAKHVSKPKKGKKAVPVNTELVSMFPRVADMRMYAKKSEANLRAVYDLK